MFDYSFFALLFAIASTLAPASSSHLELQNERHPEQSIVWDRGDDGRWALTVNGREVGSFSRDGAVVTHHFSDRGPDQHALSDLLDPATLRRRSRRFDLRGQFAPAHIDVAREDGQVLLRDPTRHLLGTELRLHHR